MSRSVLLVEDEANIAKALEVMLRREGFECRTVGDGLAALASLRESLPDLLIVDVMLPGLSGYEICREVRSDPAMRDLKILVMTAKGGNAEQRKAEALKADGFIAKPFRSAELKSLVRALIGTGDGPDG